MAVAFSIMGMSVVMGMFKSMVVTSMRMWRDSVRNEMQEGITQQTPRGKAEQHFQKRLVLICFVQWNEKQNEDGRDTDNGCSCNRFNPKFYTCVFGKFWFLLWLIMASMGVTVPMPMIVAVSMVMTSVGMSMTVSTMIVSVSVSTVSVAVSVPMTVCVSMIFSSCRRFFICLLGILERRRFSVRVAVFIVPICK